MYGAESVILNLCRSFNEEPHSSVVAVFLNYANPNLELHHRCRDEGIESHLIPSRGPVDWRAIRGLKELVSLTAADVVHAHGYKADVFVHLAFRRSKLPHVATCHNWIDNDSKAQLYGYLDRQVLSGYSRIAAVSEEVVRRLRSSGVDPRRIELILNGIDVRPFHRDVRNGQSEAGGRDTAVVGFVGRLSREKGPDIFIQAASEVLRHYERVKFILAGDGPELSTLQALIDELRIGERVLLLRHITDMVPLYQDFDIMVAPSRREGLPIAILEGMASGLPVIATSVGEVPKIIEHGRTGLLTSSEDPQLVSEKILDLLRNPAKRVELGTAAKLLITELFSAERMARDYLQFYQKAISDAERDRVSDTF